MLWREEKSLKAVDFDLELVSEASIEAVHHILLEIADDARARVTVLVRALRQKVGKFRPRLRLCVLSDETVEQFSGEFKLIGQDLILQGVTHLQHLTLMLI